MRSSTAVWVIVILVILAAGGWYYYTTQMSASSTGATTSDTTATPNGAAGINGSANQGNLGGTDTGTVQQPGADGAEGSIIGANLALGVNSDATLGKYLIAYNGMTLYTYSKDTTEASTCYDQCATNWPPYLVGAEDNLGNIQAGVTGKVGSTIRTDGGIQVTYNGHPLYYYVKDAKSGDTTGQNVGKVWFVVKP